MATRGDGPVLIREAHISDMCNFSFTKGAFRATLRGLTRLD